MSDKHLKTLEECVVSMEGRTDHRPQRSLRGVLQVRLITGAAMLRIRLISASAAIFTEVTEITGFHSSARNSRCFTGPIHQEITTSPF